MGMLLFVQLVTGLILPYVLLQPLTTPPAGFLATAAAMASQVRINVLLLFVGGAIPVGISIAIRQAARERSQGLWLWLMTLAAANFILQLIENAHWLTLLSVSQAYAGAGAADAPQFELIAVGVRAAWKWAHYSHIFVVVSWLFALFLFMFRLAGVPRVVTAVGMFTCALHFLGITLPVFAGYRMPFAMLFGMPLAFPIIALAGWLMVRGLPEPQATRGAEA
jgi:hypothetical protein